jgi:coenzyme F420-reducing hydrogenase beta subunit
MSYIPSKHGNTLSETVIEGGYCIGCGACAAVLGTPFKMVFDRYGKYSPELTTPTQPLTETDLTTICPFADHSANETEIGRRLFSDQCTFDSFIGFYLNCYAGYVTEAQFRSKGSSGGLGTWITHELLTKKMIDGVIHVRAQIPSLEDPKLFRYQISTSVEDLLGGAKSRYYPIEMSEVLNRVRQLPGKYAIVGLPCFVKAIRLLAEHDQELRERITYCVGLICGHLKTAHFASMFAWQAGLNPADVQQVDFRVKMPGQKASQYGFEVHGMVDRQLISRVKPVREFFGSDWGMGFFKPKACDFCDDVVAETADITVGDAWLPHYLDDDRGTNVVVVRNPEIDEILRTGMAEGRLKLDVLDPDSVRQSQAGGFRHRRNGLAYRLAVNKEKGWWVPSKRVLPDATGQTSQMQAIQDMRMELSRTSHEAFLAALEADDFQVFVRQMIPLIKRYQQLYIPVWWKRGLLKLVRGYRKLKNIIGSKLRVKQSPAIDKGN